ncbi:Peptidyl-prolyl cis-trans isomerase FKBP62 [Apostasia shenzhenica]|uniref:Peptidyl-prolyl cis-trans isomerase FKBP62 n=1 Tax=Apostasia shenzhenica TaxID=1088818 RepID=A0A2I0AB93_9ASPA|nr:Peptidyl-prolyl cis-trans isomerase FKBP62 [Apostasia shenzhenica]
MMGSTVTETTLSKIDRAHQMYRDSKHLDALELYTEALAMAKNKAQKIALHSSRAACYLKLHDFKKVAQECTSVLELDQQHTGALMLRAQTLVTLKDYQSALFDVNRLMELNSTSYVYQSLQARLRTQLEVNLICSCLLRLLKQTCSLAPIPESEDETVFHDENDEETISEQENRKNAANPAKNHDASADQHSQGWKAIQKPKGHSGLDYSRWDKVDDDSSEEEEEAEEQLPQYRFRVRKSGV